MNEMMEMNQKMTSREIADITGKRHSDVMRDIRNAEPSYLEVYGGERKFALSSYYTEQNKEMPEYHLTKSQTLFIVSGYDAVTRAKIQFRWEELENAAPKVWTLEESLKHQLKLIEQNKALEQKIEEDKPKIVFADAVAGSDNSILVRQFAKVLSDDGFSIGQNKLYEWLRKNKYLNSKNEPYQNYVEQGLFEVIERTIGASDQTFTTRTTKITGKGQVYFAKKLRET